ncbi:MAG: hypothetical protein KUG64_10835 [Cycloclasticus sp.]|nr:hypothetical protein [Cycloclasticus sp.]
MDINSITEITTALSSLGDDATKAFIAWLVLQGFVKIAGMSGWFFFLVVVYKIGEKLLLLLGQNTTLKELRTLLDAGTSGELTKRECDQILSSARSMKEENTYLRNQLREKELVEG